MAVIDLYRRDFAAALDQWDHTIELNPHFSPAYLTLGIVQELLEDFDEAVAALKRAVYLSPDTPRMHAGLARALARAGKREEAQRIFAGSKNRHGSATSPRSNSRLSTWHLATWRPAKRLAKAVTHRCFEILALNVDPRFEALRKDL